MKTKNKFPCASVLAAEKMKNKKEMIRVLKLQRMRSFWMLQAGKTVVSLHLQESWECPGESQKESRTGAFFLKAAILDEVYDSLEKEFDSIEE